MISMVSPSLWMVSFLLMVFFPFPFLMSEPNDLILMSPHVSAQSLEAAPILSEMEVPDTHMAAILISSTQNLRGSGNPPGPSPPSQQHSSGFSPLPGLLGFPLPGLLGSSPLPVGFSGFAFPGFDFDGFFPFPFPFLIEASSHLHGF